MKRCTRCVLPEHYPGIEFNEAGVCNYCLNYKKRIYKGRDELDRLLGSFRNKGGKYDCVVGVSGGRDSAYALYYLVKEYNLRTLAYTSDNGFLPDVSINNVKKMTGILGVDVIIEEHDYVKRCVKNNVSALLRRPIPQMVQMICCGCRMGVARGLFECARRNKIPWIVVGGGTPVEICYYKRAFLNTNLFGRKSEPVLMALALSYEMIKSPFYLTPTSMSVFAAEYFYYFTAGIRGLVYPNQKALRLYHYIEWDEDKILSTIKTELNWEKGADSASAWRADCRIAWLKNYLLSEGFGFTEKDDYFSNMIREDMITRKEAFDRLKNEEIIPQEVITELCDEIGLNPARLSAAMEMARRNALRKK